MWLKCKLVFNHYHPEQLEKGMMFERIVFERGYAYKEIYKLDRIPNMSLEEYINEHGFPVSPCIVYEGNGNDEIPTVLADSSHIGWWDEGEDSDEYYDVTLKELNTILNDFEGDIYLLMEDNGASLTPDIFEGKCILTYPGEETIFTDDLINYNDTDFKEFTNQEEEEEW